MMQARWGSHGAYEIIALTPSTPQEMFGLTVRAFNLSEEYRLPVLLMSDEVIGHMCEKVIIPNSVKLKNRALPTIHSSKYLPFETSDNLIPTIPNAGMGYKIHLTGLTHDERGYPIMDGETQEKLVRRLNDKIRKHKAKIIEFEELLIEDAEIVIISYGISARVAISALRRARKNNIKVGMLKLLTVWPFPEEFLEELSEQVKAFIVPELNYGQIYYEVKRCSKGKEVILVPKMGGATHEPEDIYKTIRKVS
jgi:2-oxoglutarate ferredoxin oxidoreductase subunit alpha